MGGHEILMGDATDLNTLCDDLLAASVEALDTIPGYDVSLAGAPERAFVSSGLPTLDCCDQLAVSAIAVNEAPTAPGGLGAGRRNVTGRRNLVGLVVTITRCVPGPDEEMNPPTVAELEASAAQTNADAWALWNHLWEMWRADLLFTFCGEVFWDGLRSLPASGGCGGSTLTLRVSLDGYDDVTPTS